jgi:phosphoesterase RecJ-like protein
VFQRIRGALDGGRKFLVTTHIDPDGDALGSAFAMAFALTGLGKDAAVYLRDPIPYRYTFLPRPAPILHKVPENTYDTVVVLDCSSLARLGDEYGSVRRNRRIINIDHHEAGDPFGEINIIDARASSAAEILYLILKSLGVPFTFDIAANLYTAVMTDTGSFRYDNTTKLAFSICQEMTGFGVSPSSVAAEVYENHPRKRYALLCLVLATIETFHADRIALAHVTGDMFAETRTNREHTEGFVEYLKEIGGVEVACLIRELGAGKWKISMRSKGSVDVASVARSFGGGGHRKAAGCVLEGDIETAKNILIGAFSL